MGPMGSLKLKMLNPYAPHINPETFLSRLVREPTLGVGHMAVGGGGHRHSTIGAVIITYTISGGSLL